MPYACRCFSPGRASSVGIPLFEELPILDAEGFPELARHCEANFTPIILDCGKVRVLRPNSRGKLHEGEACPCAIGPNEFAGSLYYLDFLCEIGGFPLDSLVIVLILRQDGIGQSFLEEGRNLAGALARDIDVNMARLLDYQHSTPRY